METIDGYFILIDIKNSVDRKQVDQNSWVEDSFSWVKRMQQLLYEITLTYPSLTEKNFKFLGDGVMVFLKSEGVINAKISCKILEKIVSFTTDTKVQQYVDNQHIWRTVICYLKDVSVIELHSNWSDHLQIELIGEEIDFAFRLEKFADTSHIIVNESFYRSVVRELPKLGLDVIPCLKTVKGWNRQGIEVYALTNPDLIEKTILNNTPNPGFMDINLELFQYYVETKNSEV